MNNNIPQNVLDKINDAMPKEKILRPIDDKKMRELIMSWAIFAYQLRDEEVKELKDKLDESEQSWADLNEKYLKLFDESVKQLTSANKRIKELTAEKEAWKGQYYDDVDNLTEQLEGLKKDTDLWIEREKGLCKRIECLEEVLNKIAYPIKNFQIEAEKQGMKLNGQEAIRLADNANYLRELAQSALKQ